MYARVTPLPSRVGVKGRMVFSFGMSPSVYVAKQPRTPMATNVLLPLSVSGNGVGSGEPRAGQLPPKPVRHPRAKQILSEGK